MSKGNVASVVMGIESCSADPSWMFALGWANLFLQLYYLFVIYITFFFLEYFYNNESIDT